MKKIFLLLACLTALVSGKAQTIYSNSFNNLSLQTYTTSTSSTFYSALPATFNAIDDGWINNAGSIYHPNKPFHVPGLEASGWAVVYNEIDNDTFMVSTSWIDTTGISVDRWAITPPISNLTPNSVLTWLAKSPDANFSDGYEVYGTTQQGTLFSSSFTIGDRLFAIVDGNTGGGGEKNTWTRRSVPLGAFAGQTLRFAFRNNSRDMYQVWIDDIAVINTPNAIDAGLTNSITKKYILSNTSDSVQIKVSNFGASTIATILLNYQVSNQVSNSSVNTENIAFTNGLAYGQSAYYTFALPYTATSPGFYTIKSWLSDVNGQGDQNSSNDTTRYDVTVQSVSPAKTVLFEQFTSAANGDGPDGQEKSLLLQSDSLIVVNIHDQDSMQEMNAAALRTDYEHSMVTAMIDRTYFSDLGTTAVERSYYTDRTNKRNRSITPVSVSVLNKSYNASTRQLSFTLEADFAGEVRGDYRMSAYITENQVGAAFADTIINGYNQYSYSYDTPWSAYYQLGYYSPVANAYILDSWLYRHQNTLIYTFNGAYGLAGIIPSTGGTQGHSYQENFSVTLPPLAANGVYKYNPDNMYIVGFAAEYSTDKTKRQVLNAVKEKLNSNPEFVGLPELSKNGTFSVYPNPSSGVFNIRSTDIAPDYEITVYNVLGKSLRSLHVTQDQDIRSLDLSALSEGVYFLKIRVGDQNFTQKIVIQKGQN